MAFSLPPLDGEAPLGRRQFLGGLTLACVAGLIGEAPAAEGESNTIALISDTHIDADPGTVAREQRMARNLQEVASRILDLKDKPAGAIIDGDLALKNGRAGDYRTLTELLNPIRRAGLPIHLALGNHDDRENFRTTLKIEPHPKFTEKHVVATKVAGLRLLLLDSLQRPDFTPGLLGDTQRAWLSATLDDSPETPTLVFVHHNLDAKSSGALNDTAQLLDVLKTRRQVKGVVFGHTHVWSTREVDGLHLINLPAVGYPFAKTEPIGWTQLTAREGGAELKLHAIGGDRSKDGEIIGLKWRSL